MAEQGRRGARRPPRARVETSAGGVIYRWHDEFPHILLIRDAYQHWGFPKGHLEEGETAEDAAVREVKEETGIRGVVLAPLGTIDYWFVAENRRVHKTVHHYLLEAAGGELSDEDIEVTEVAWVPLTEVTGRLAYADERRLLDKVPDLLAETA